MVRTTNSKTTSTASKRGRKTTSNDTENDTETQTKTSPVTTNPSIVSSGADLDYATNNENENENITTDVCMNNDTIQEKPSRKRGRKPKGGKIINTAKLNEEATVTLPNVIVHFKYRLEELEQAINNEIGETLDTLNDFSRYTNIITSQTNNSNEDKKLAGSGGNNNIQGGSFTSMHNQNTHIFTNDVIPNDNIYGSKGYELSFAYVDDQAENHQNITTENVNLNNTDINHNETKLSSANTPNFIITNNPKYLNQTNAVDINLINDKIRIMEVNFHKNNTNGKRSACFWDTCAFDTPAFYIPKSIDTDNVQPYGCFCSLNCALAYLHSEEIDASTKFERRQLLFNLYSEIVGNKTFVKPAPNPRYTLDKFYGNLTIQEWRSLLAGDRMLLIVDKPLTPELPELHTETIDRFMTMGSVNATDVAQYGKFKIRKAAPKQTKGDIVAEKFGLVSSAAK